MRRAYVLAGPAMFVDIDERRCVGCGLCEENHPDVFTMGKQFAKVVQPIVPPELREAIRQTAADCPAGAIVTEEYPQ